MLCITHEKLNAPFEESKTVNHILMSTEHNLLCQQFETPYFIYRYRYIDIGNS